jgi:peptide/nickel transport system permease protein
MLRFTVRRLLNMIFVLWAVSVLTFLIFMVMPGGGENQAALRIAGRNANEAQIETVKKQWGLDDPFYVQYGQMMKKVFTGDLISYVNQQNVTDEIKRGIPRTMSLVIGAGLIWLFFGILFGVLSAVYAGRFTDRALNVLALIGISLPVFWVGLVLLYYLTDRVQLFPPGGYTELGEDPVDWAYHLILPWFALSILFIGFYSRVLRSNILDIENEDYVRTARAKGLTETRVLVRHVLRNSLIPIVALWGLDFAAVIGGGAILTESVFNLHGVGQYAAQSIGQLDVPPVLVIVMFGSFFVVLMSAVTDVLIAVLDPRIKLAG